MLGRGGARRAGAEEVNRMAERICPRCCGRGLSWRSPSRCDRAASAARPVYLLFMLRRQDICSRALPL